MSLWWQNFRHFSIYTRQNDTIAPIGKGFVVAGNKRNLITASKGQ